MSAHETGVPAPKRIYRISGCWGLRLSAMQRQRETNATAPVGGQRSSGGEIDTCVPVIRVAVPEVDLHHRGMPRISMASSTEVLAGLVDRVTFHNAENGFCVLRVKARGQRDAITVIGHAATISAGEFVQASGSWINDRTHGVQFRASFLKATAPTTVEGIEKYLGSGMIRGIGPIYAKKLVRAFAETVFEVIEQEPGRLREVTGIGPKRAQRIIAGWAEQKVIREIMLFLHSNGVGTSRAVRIYKTYGTDAIKLISENPYRLARDIRGMGFRTADQIAAKLGIEKTALIRVRAGISFALAEAMDEGHCGLPTEELVPLTQKLLEVPAELIATALDFELRDGTVIADDLDGRQCVFLAGLYRAEREIAETLRALTAGRPPWPSIDADKAIPWVEKRTKLALAGAARSRPAAGNRAKYLVDYWIGISGQTQLLTTQFPTQRNREFIWA
jgi:exodeoxyribonuclease V alpha subunit